MSDQAYKRAKGLQALLKDEESRTDSSLPSRARRRLAERRMDAQLGPGWRALAAPPDVTVTLVVPAGEDPRAHANGILERARRLTAERPTGHPGQLEDIEDDADLPPTECKRAGLVDRIKALLDQL